MTLRANQDVDRPQNIKVSCTYGPISFYVSEELGHVRNFWSELGRLLEQIDAQKVKT